MNKRNISFLAVAFFTALFATSCSPKDSNSDEQYSSSSNENGYESAPQVWIGPGYYYGIYYGDEAAYRAWRRSHWRRGYYRRGRRYDRRQYRRGPGYGRGVYRGGRRGGRGRR